MWTVWNTGLRMTESRQILSDQITCMQISLLTYKQNLKLFITIFMWHIFSLSPFKGKSCLKTELQFSDMYCLMAAHVYIDLWIETGKLYSSALPVE